MSKDALWKKEIDTIFKEVHLGRINCLKSIKEKDPNFHWSCITIKKTGDSVLHIAAQLGHIDVINYLLTYKPNGVNCKNNDDKTALHEAAQFHQYSACETLIKNGADVNAIKRADWTPLMLACTKIHPDNSFLIIESLLKSGAFVNYKNKDGWTALHLICREGSLKILKLLIAHGLDLKAKSKNGRAALHVAALHRNYDIVHYLISLGANIEETDNCGNTPLQEAVLGRSIAICNLLIENNANIHHLNNIGFNLLHLAASEGYLDVMNYIINDLKFDINSKTSNGGFTALHCAARKKQHQTYDKLLELGCDENLLDNFNRKPSEYFK